MHWDIGVDNWDNTLANCLFSWLFASIAKYCLLIPSNDNVLLLFSLFLNASNWEVDLLPSEPLVTE